MPYFTDGAAGPNPGAISLDDLPASSGAALSASIDSAWDSNPSVLAHDWWQMRSANQGVRLDNDTAAALIKQAGVKLSVPTDGYTQTALDLLIQRKQTDARLQDILARAPTGFMPTTTRFAAQLATGLADPLNIAAGFIPVVGEARTASMLGRAGESVLARTAARAGIGAAEGTVGVGVLEPFAYGAHQQLQDDYSMVDSLRNVGFGAVLGGTLHVGGGLIADTMRAGPHPAARFGDMSVGDVQLALNFERERATMAPADQARVLETFTPQMRRAVEEHAPGDTVASVPDHSAAAIASRPSPEIRETAMRSAVADLVSGRTPDVDAILQLDRTPAPDGTLPTPSLDAVRATTQRQVAPESLAVGDFFASRAADERLAEAPRSTRQDAADTALTAAMDRVQALHENLVQGGMDPAVSQSMVDSLKPWDAGIADADNLGQAARAAALCGLRA
jgi:hypothetical protein